MTLATRLLGGLMGLAVGSAFATEARGACDVTGTVRDADARPVVGIDVRLEQGASPRHTTTDEQGRFRFATVPSATEVVVVLQPGGDAPRFVILEGGKPVELRAPVDPAEGCEVQLGAESPRLLAGDFLALYQGLARASALMDRLGIGAAQPLRVEANDRAASEDAVFWAGPSSLAPDDPQPTRMVLGARATTRDDPGAPDNREYHEMGHHALATAFGALPRARDEVTDASYHQNPGSTHAWTEGFAIFFAAMVAAEIEQRPDAVHYPVEGAWLDLELDYRPWDLRGTESVAVASLLWDMVDGDRQQAAPSPLTVVESRLVADAGVPHLLVGRVDNPSSAPVRSGRVQVEAPDWTGSAPIVPGTLPAGEQGWFALPVPASVADAKAAGVSLKLRAGTIFAGADDDPVQVDLDSVWTAIAELRSERPGSNGRLFDVSDLYQALRGRFGGRDEDSDGRDDIDQLFIAHGLHADSNGNRQYDAGETLGLTSHPGRTIETDGGPIQWPELSPRHRLRLPDGLRMMVQTQPAEARYAVLLPTSPGGGYAAVPDDDGRIPVLPPPAAGDAQVAVVALADGRRPTVLWQQSATDLLTELERHDEPWLTASGDLPVASATDDAVAGGSQWPRMAFLGGAMATLLGLVLMGIGWPRLR